MNTRRIAELAEQFENGNKSALARTAASFQIPGAVFDVVAEKAKVAVQMMKVSKKERAFSKLGGKPNLGKDFEWPTYQEKPMAFIGQIALSEVPPAKDTMLPEKGFLYIFYDQTNSAWGFEAKHKNSTKVIYIEENATILEETEFPENLPNRARFHEKFLTFRKTVTLDEFNEKDFSEEIQENYDLDYAADGFYMLKQALLGGEEAKVHQLGGNPTVIQNDNMEELCQVCSRGIDIYEKENREKVKEIQKEPNDWTMLFQFDSDEDCGMGWGDYGRMYVWIREEDLKRKEFGNVWSVLQCG